MTVVVGYTPRPQGRAALRVGIAEARARGEDLYVLNVSSGASLSDPTYATEEQWAEVVEELRASGVEHRAERHVDGRGGAEEVTRAAAEHDATLVVIGIRHRTATGKMLFGSDAQRILLDVDCPVLAVKA
ncbi:universal stress protein [Modestobacter sp. Leaf380]|uniref:universal stress protein n=1 Tax=Modestobacter sp. Leaf380 TaxID=1736356 RepID=UPI0006F95D52|nr:universal stress protein [Modestobacter sp. Leaf380]KQS72135.1 universal stress protein UspA [Modestobacter sp. Leaf380]